LILKSLTLLTKLAHFLPSEFAHNLALYGLKFMYKLGFKINHKTNLDYKFFKQKFSNKLGLAAGLDKNGDFIDALASLGFGFLEIGTVTPLSQPGNPKPRLFRVKSKRALVNRMGFNNKGVDHLINKIRSRKSKIPLGISIGKNFNTTNEKAHLDYLYCLNKVYTHASYIAINISSPNTEGLRDLQQKSLLNTLLACLKKRQMELTKEHGYKPLFIKISPDSEINQLEELFRAIIEHGVDGLICCNTSTNHSYLEGKGGISGAPLLEVSNEILRRARKALGDDFPIIASGGVMTKNDYEKKVMAGAS